MFDFNELSNLYFSNVAGWFSPAVRNNNLQFTSAGAMKKTLLITSTIILLLSLIGCSNFEDTTSVGSQLIDEADPSFLDFDQNYKKLPLDTGIVMLSKSVPENSSDSNFGVHTASVLPVGGNDGEISTAYYQFKPSSENWLKFRNIDTLFDSANIYSTELLFSTKPDTLNSVCSFDQTINLLFLKDSSFKYNRNQVVMEKLLDPQSDKVRFRQKLDTANLKIVFNDKDTLSKMLRDVFSYKRSEYDTMESKGRNVFKDTLKLPTFDFVIASNDIDTGYALMSGAAGLKVHFYKGEYKSSAADTLKDTLTLDTLYQSPTPQHILISRTKFIGDSLYDSATVLYDTLYNIVEDTLICSLDTIEEKNKDGDTTLAPPTVKIYDPVKMTKRVKRNDSTLVIDTITHVKVTKQIRKIIDTLISVSSFNAVHIDSIITKDTVPEDSIKYICKTVHYKIDTINQTIDIKYDTLIRVDTTITLDTIVMKADSISIPLTYSNYVMYENKETIGSRANPTGDPISSYGPQRTAVFKLNIDSLRKTLDQPPIDGKPAFNKILSAGVAITGTLDPSYLKTMSDITDTMISVRWFVSESEEIMHDGLQLHKTDKATGRIDTLKNGKEAVLPIEKNLQEILSRKLSLPSNVYLYLEPISTKNFNKQVFWSKPSLLTVLTTSTKE